MQKKRRIMSKYQIVSQFCFVGHDCWQLEAYNVGYVGDQIANTKSIGNTGIIIRAIPLCPISLK